MNLDAERFLEDLTGKHARHYIDALTELLVGIATKNRTAQMSARSRLGKVISETMGVAEVLGATLVLRGTAKVIIGGGVEFQSTERLVLFANTSTQAILPRVTLTEAVQDMVDRTPVTIRRAAERTASEIARLYSEDRVVAFVKSAEAAVTKRVQDLIAEAIREGITEADVAESIVRNISYIRKRTKKWTKGYARMVFRTNVNTAVTAGRFRQAQDEDVKSVIPCFRFDAIRDGDARKNHEAADGLIFKVDNAIWNAIAPPLGYNCRCRVSLVSLPMLIRMGRFKNGEIREDRLPRGAFADDGFRHAGRPDLFMVAA